MLAERIQAFEIQDLPWCPKWVRDGVTDWLQFVLVLLDMYGPIVPLILDAMKRTGSTRIVDLCSGGSGPVAKIVRDSGIEAVLTDKYPNVPRFEEASRRSDGAVTFESRSVDATAVPKDLHGMRTLFTSFHHFDDEAAHGILRSAVEAGQPIGVFEFTERSVWSILMTAPTPVMMFFGTPLVRPWRLSRWVGTYLIPFIPMVALFDVIVSVFRTRSVKELAAMAAKYPTYDWQVGKTRSAFWMPVLYLVGTPKEMTEGES